MLVFALNSCHIAGNFHEYLNNKQELACTGADDKLNVFICGKIEDHEKYLKKYISLKNLLKFRPIFSKKLLQFSYLFLPKIAKFRNIFKI